MTSSHVELATAPVPVPPEGRVQLALRVSDLSAAVEFYSALFGAAPAKLKPGYANFAIAAPPLKLVLIESESGGQIDHLGVEVPETADVSAAAARLEESGLVTLEENESACCYAVQDKVWVAGPDRERWEVYTVLADSDRFAGDSDAYDRLLDASETPATSAACCGPSCCG